MYRQPEQSVSDDIEARTSFAHLNEVLEGFKRHSKNLIANIELFKNSPLF